MSLEFDAIRLEPVDPQAAHVPEVLQALHRAGVHYSLALGERPDPDTVRRRMAAVPAVIGSRTTVGCVWMFDVHVDGARVGTLCVVDDGMLYFGIAGGDDMRAAAGDACTLLAEHFFTTTTTFDRMYVFVDLRDQALMDALFDVGFERVVDLTSDKPRALVGVILREVFEMPIDDEE